MYTFQIGNHSKNSDDQNHEQMKIQIPTLIIPEHNFFFFLIILYYSVSLTINIFIDICNNLKCFARIKVFYCKNQYFFY